LKAVIVSMIKEVTMNSNNIFFQHKQSFEKAPADNKKPWKIIIADDEAEVHNVTRMVLSDYSFEGRSLQFLSAYSGKETKELIQNNPDTAIVLLDVVMETEDAGLQLARYIRQDLNNQFVRIILRTGQPGKAPEKDVIINYDINEYKEKTDLTVQKLFTTITTALRSYRDLRIIEKNRAGLEQIIKASGHLFENQSVKEFAKGVLTQLISLLKLDESSVYIQSGFCELTEKNDFIVLAATGEYENATDRNASEILSQEVVQLLMRAIKEDRSLFIDDVFVGYFATKSGKKNLLYLKSCDHLSKLDKNLLEVFSNNVAIAFENILLNKELVESQNKMLLTLGEVVENRSSDVGKHAHRVSLFCHLLALLSGLSNTDVDLIRLVSPMHDVGKIAIPDSILFKPGKLTKDEFEAIKPHTTIGFDIFKNSNRTIMQAAAIVASQHHERWDGTGYPHKLKGEGIHIFGRITGLADVFDSLTHWRIYKNKWNIDKVVELIKEQKGHHFDPMLVDILLEHLDAFVEINNKYPD
jgi:response regulator RpfG family c-di-GMP phosphodiesterase